MSLALLLLATALTCELFRRLPILARVRGSAETAQRSVKLIGNGAVSDHWKERILPRYAQRMAGSALTALGLIVIAVLPVLAVSLVSGSAAAFLVSWQGILGLTAFALVYLVLRSRLAPSGEAAGAAPGYSPLARALHRFALSSPAQGEMLFDIENATAAKPPAGAEEGRHVFVVGLARAGTTVLMRAIHESGQFASLTYRDMPFVMAPNLWARLSGGSRRQMEKTERAHGDGLLVDYDSPEALEEPFWRTFCGKAYIRPDALVPHAVDAEIVANYRTFVAHVLTRHGATRYLAKNNNGVLRIAALEAAFPQAAILIPFREPRSQALSLMRQHDRFADGGDPFTTRYMGWLAHHEFGGDHRPFVIDGRRPKAAPASLDHWIEQWSIVYGALFARIESDGAQLIPVAYEDLCRSDRAVWQALCERIGIPAIEAGFEERRNAAPEEADAALLAEADALYEKLRAASRARLGLPPEVPTAPL